MKYIAGVFNGEWVQRHGQQLRGGCRNNGRGILPALVGAEKEQVCQTSHLLLLVVVGWTMPPLPGSVFLSMNGWSLDCRNYNVFFFLCFCFFGFFPADSRSPLGICYAFPFSRGHDGTHFPQRSPHSARRSTVTDSSFQVSDHGTLYCRRLGKNSMAPFKFHLVPSNLFFCGIP